MTARWPWFLLFALETAVPLMMALVLWCAWTWHAVPLGAPGVGYVPLAAGCFVYKLFRLQVTRESIQGTAAERLHLGLTATLTSYLSALITLAALWLLSVVV